MRYLISFRGRVLSYALALIGLATLGPHLPREIVPVILSPTGLGLLALVLILVGAFVEELGRMSRIRVGIGIRLSAVAAISSNATLILMEPSKASVGGFGWVLVVISAVPIIVIARYDFAVLRDPRHGQSTRFEALDRYGLRLRFAGHPATIPIAQVLETRIQSMDDGRGVFLTVQRSSERSLLDAIPWTASAVHGDVLLLTEHQLGMDADDFVTRLGDAIRLSELYR